jgi:hypothetical protein
LLEQAYVEQAGLEQAYLEQAGLEEPFLEKGVLEHPYLDKPCIASSARNWLNSSAASSRVWYPL